MERALSQHLEASEFVQAQAGLHDAAHAYGVEIVGGHSLSLNQPMIAVQIEGECTRPVHKVGAMAGDELWITGPVGSGILFSALASGFTVGAFIDQWVTNALKSLFEASQTAAQEGVHAMTDVTGFGLAGHLREMLSGKNLGIQWAENIVTFSGVDECIARGGKARSVDRELYSRH